MSKSIINNNKNKCYLCNHPGETVKFYCISSNNLEMVKKAENDGMYVFLCKDHPFRFKETQLCEGCINFIKRDSSFKRMLIGIAEDKWKDVHKATHKDYVKEYGEQEV